MNQHFQQDTPFRREAKPLPLPPGNLFLRLMTAKVLASIHRCTPLDVAAFMWPNDRAIHEFMTKASTAPAMTTTAGWAAELAQRYVADIMDALGAASAAIDVFRECLTLNWDGHGLLAAPSFVASAGNGSFVQEGNPIPVRQLTDALVLVQPYKVASIAVLTREMMEGSNAEALIGDTLIKSAALAIDAVFFSSAAATAAAPAGIRNGISTSTASVNTDPFAAVFEDVATLINAVSAVGGKGPYAFVAGPGRAISFGMRIDTEKTGGIVPVGSTAVGNDLIAIAPQGIVAAFSPDPDVETADTGTLVMDNAAPGTPGQAGASERGLFQTDSIALKIRWPVSWMVRDSRAVAWMTPSWK